MTLFKSVGATGGVPKYMFASIETATNTRKTFESPIGTDYKVGTGKTLKILKMICSGSTGTDIHISYGDNGVDEGTTLPTNEVFVVGSGSSGFSSLFIPEHLSTYSIDLYLEIPADKYPCLVKPNTVKTGAVLLIGIEE